MSKQQYFPIGIISNDKKLHPISYNEGTLVNDNIASKNDPFEMQFLIENIKSPIDFLTLEEEVKGSLLENGNYEADMSATIKSYDGECAKISLTYSGCTGNTLLENLFKSQYVLNLTENGSIDWFPVDTQTLSRFYPSYDQPTYLNESNSACEINEERSLLEMINSTDSSVKEKLYAEFFKTFLSGDHTSINVAKEGKIIVSVARELLVSAKMQHIMANTAMLLSMLNTPNASSMHSLIWMAMNFHQVKESFISIIKLLEALNAYKENLAAVYEKHQRSLNHQFEELIKCTLDALKAIETMDLHQLDELLLKLSVLLKDCSEGLMDFTNDVKEKIVHLKEMRDETHRYTIGAAFGATAALGYAVLSKNSKSIVSKASKIAIVAGGVAATYYYYQLECELDSFIAKQTSVVSIASNLVNTLNFQKSNLPSSTMELFQFNDQGTDVVTDVLVKDLNDLKDSLEAILDIFNISSEDARSRNQGLSSYLTLPSYLKKFGSQ